MAYPKLMTAAVPGLLRRFARDDSGAYAIITAIALPVLIGFAGLATEATLWLQKRQVMQGAADSAALSAAMASIRAGNKDVEARAITGTYGFVDGSDGVVVTVNQPPKSGAEATVAGAIEVIVRQPQKPLFSAIWSSSSINVSARAVASPTGGSGCVLALNPTVSGAVTISGNASIALNNCSLYDNSSSGTALSLSGSSSLSALSVGVVGGVSGASHVTTTQGVATGFSTVFDPYSNVTPPSFSGCTRTSYASTATETLSPGVYCGGMTLSAGANITLSALSVGGGASLSGSGVTIVFTSSTGANWATASISGNSTVNLTPPTSGITAGIALFGDRNMTTGTAFSLIGGGAQSISGAIYLPKAALTYQGGASTGAGCTQLIVNTVSLTGNSGLAVNCAGFATRSVGSNTVALLE